jgi:1-acyl-sn-glycerol-3-phosphate acyltransferase
MTVMGAEHVPPGRCLIVGCHSGVMPWDAACLVVAVRKHTGRFPRSVADRLWVRIPQLAAFLHACGVVLGEPARVAEVLERDEAVIVFPGGAEDMKRPIWERYRVYAHRGFAPGRGGYVKLALRTGSPIVPVAIVGAEETHIMLADVPALARAFGAPFFPIVASPLPLPARIYVRFGEPITLAAPPEAAGDQVTVDRLNAETRRVLQAHIDDTVAHRRGIYWSRYRHGGSRHAGPGRARAG